MPVANGQSVTTTEDVAKAITLTGSDVEGSTLTYAIVTPPTNGSLSAVSGSGVTYTPNTNYNGSDSFTFTVSDGGLTSVSATVSITVDPVNDAPIANNQSVTTNEDVAKAITLTGSDAEGSLLTYSIVTPPTNGSLSAVSGSGVTYTPNANYNGLDSFTFRSNDGTEDSNVAIVLITISAVDDAPVAFNQTSTPIITSENVAKSITLEGSDPDNNILTFIIVTSPVHGTLSGANENLIYTPFGDYNGSDSFTFKANDGTTDSNIATVLITVTPVQDNPTADSQSVILAEDGAQSIILSGSDVDGDVISYSIVTQPSNGTITGASPTLTYTPYANYNGSDTFTFKTNDGLSDSNIGTVFITVTPIDDPPVAFDQTATPLTTPENIPKPIKLDGTDPDGDVLSYIIISNPLHGILSGSGANWIYTPTVDYNGADSFTFKANDGTTDSNIATVLISVLPVNDAPIADNQLVTTLEDEAKDILLTASDTDGNVLGYLVLTQPTHGTLTGTGSNLTYTPLQNYFGGDSFTFSASDGFTDSNIATVSLLVTPVNDPPIITPIPDLFVKEDSLLQVCLNVVDPEGDEVVFNLPSNISGGGTMAKDVAPYDFCFIFTPSPNFNGTSVWEMKVSDINGLSGTTPLNIIVMPVNDPPILIDLIATTKENTSLTGSVHSLGDIDPDGTVLNVNTVPQSGPSNGVIVINVDGSYTYTPSLNFFGRDKVNIQICDNGIPLPSACATKVLTIDVTRINTLPPSSISTSTAEDTPTSFCFNYVDPQGDKITLGSIVNISGGGTLKATKTVGLCFDFSPALNFNGAAIWEIEICDDGSPSLCTKLTATINVTPVNDPPVALRDSVAVLRRVLQDGNVLANDYDIEKDALSVTTIPVTDVLHGELTLTSDGRFTYISDKTFRGLDFLVYEVCDNGSPSKCSTATLVINVEDLPFKVYEGVTPNGDGNNDYLRIEGIDFYPNCTVRIFDRYNNLVFEMAGYNNEEKVWRGNANKGIGNDVLQEGTYFYTVNLGDGSNMFSGFVVLKRN